jgi:hypothetical protein
VVGLCDKVARWENGLCIGINARDVMIRADRDGIVLWALKRVRRGQVDVCRRMRAPIAFDARTYAGTGEKGYTPS